MRPAVPIPAPRPDEVAASENARPTTVSAGASRTPFITECPGLFCRDDFRFEIAVLRFQRTAIQTSLLWDPGLSAGYVCATVRDDLGICDADTVFVPAIPQPDNKIVVIGEVAVSALKALQVPVFLQVDGPQEPCFLVCFVGAVTKADIRAAAGMHWPKDAEVFVGFCQTPMREADCVNPTQGLLFRLVPPGRLPSVARSLDAKIADPYDLLHLAVDALPQPFPGVSRIGILARDGLSFAVDANTCITVGDLKKAVGCSVALTPAAMSLFGPCEPIRDLTLHGDAVASVLGVLPTSLHHACGVFVDPRDIGFPVALIVLPPSPYTLTGVLELLRIPRPQELAFSLHGVDVALTGPTCNCAGMTMSWQISCPSLANSRLTLFRLS